MSNPHLDDILHDLRLHISEFYHSTTENLRPIVTLYTTAAPFLLGPAANKTIM